MGLVQPAVSATRAQKPDSVRGARGKATTETAPAPAPRPSPPKKRPSPSPKKLSFCGGAAGVAPKGPDDRGLLDSKPSRKGPTADASSGGRYGSAGPAPSPRSEPVVVDLRGSSDDEAAPPAQPRRHRLSLGAAVELVGLSNAEFNGRRGVVAPRRRISRPAASLSPSRAGRRR